MKNSIMKSIYKPRTLIAHGVLAENPLRSWQRYIAVFMVYLFTLQLCLPAVAIAATMFSSDQFSVVLNSPAYKATGKSSGAMYARPNYLQVDTQSGSTIASFHKSLTGSALADTALVVGDEFVQQRLIRAQMSVLLGRTLVDPASLLLNNDSKKAYELTQNDALFAAGVAFGKGAQPKTFGTPLSAQDIIANDMVWPEKRIINGAEVIIPVVYLSSATLSTKPEGHQINFGLSTLFNNIEVNKGVVVSAQGNENYTNVIASLNNIVNAGSINGAGNLKLVAGNTFVNLSGQIKATNDLDIRAIKGDVVNKTQLIPYQSKDGSGTRLAALATIDSTTGSIKITSGGGITYEGGISNALFGALTLNANGDIVLAPVATSSQSTTKDGHWTINKSSVELMQSKLTVKQMLTLMAGGSISITASELHSTEGGIELLAKHGIYVADEQGHFQSNRVDKIGKTQGTGSDFESFAVRSVLSAQKGVLLATDSGDVILKGAKITSNDGTQVKASNGKVRLLVTKENSQHYLDTVRTGKWTIKTVHEEYLQETGIPNAIVGGLAVEALLGVDVEYAGREGATLQQQIDEYEKMPDTKWMADIYYGDTKFKDANGNLVALNTVVDFSKVELAYKHVREHNTSLSPAAMAIIAICVAVAMGPAGANALSGISTSVGAFTGSTALGAAASAGALTLATAAAQNLAAGKSLEDTLKALSSDDGLKNLAISMVTAGALNALDVGNLELFKDAPVGSGLDFANQAYQAVVQSTVTAGVSVTINGGNSDDYLNAFKVSLATNAINTIGQNFTNKITSSNTLSEASKYIAHAAMGCLTQGLTAKLNDTDARDACASAAGGAIIAQGLSDILEFKLKELTATVSDADAINNNSKNMAETFSYLSKNGVDVSRLLAGFAAFAVGGDINAAANSASAVTASQRESLLRAAAVGETIVQMGLANCGDVGINKCGQLALEKNLRDGWFASGKYTQQQIDDKIIYLKTQTPLFNGIGDYYDIFFSKKGSLEGLVSKPKSNTDTVQNNNDATIVEVVGSEWGIMRRGVYDFGKTIGIVKDTSDKMAQEGIARLLETPLGAPIKWGSAQIATAASKFPQVKALLNDVEQAQNAIGIGSLSILVEDGFTATKAYVDGEPEAYDQENHKSDKNVVDGFVWLALTVGGLAALKYASSGLKIVTSDDANHARYINGELDYYDAEILPYHIKVSRAELKGFLSNNNIPLRGGWDGDRLYNEVLSKVPPDRPNPEDYLPAEYIAAHLKSFEGGVVRVTKNTYVESGGKLALDGADSFVFPLNEWNKIKTLTNGDPRKMEELLGIPKDYFKDRNDVYVAAIDPQDITPVKFPTGNELGANPLWAPGLKTLGGVSEGVTVINPTALQRAIRLDF